MGNKELNIMAHIILEYCLNCGECSFDCPEDAIYPGDTQYCIDPNKCIDCGICHELCSYAIPDS